jgi:hypothetical protein
MGRGHGTVGVIGLGVLLLASPAAFGETFRWVDRSGNVRYTDRPPQPEEVQPAPGASAAAPVAPSSAVQELMELSGLRQQLEWMAVTTRAQMQTRLGALEAEERAAVDRVAASTFGAHRLLELVQESLAAHVDEPTLAQILTWYRTASARKITAAELVAGMPQGQQEIAEYARTRATQRPEPGRVERLKRLDEAAGTSEFNFDILLAVADGLRRAVEPYVSMEHRKALAGADRAAVGARAQVVATLRATTLIASEFAYRDVTDAELDAYVTFLKSPSGRVLVGEVHRALLHAIRTTTEEGVVAIAGVIPPHLWGRARPRPAPDAKAESL